MQGDIGKPYIVEKNTANKFICDSHRCLHYKTSNVCAHIVAVGILLTDNLHLFIDWYKRNNQSANITSLAQSGIPIGGKKPKKRKGVSKSQSKNISKILENDEWSHAITFSNVTMSSSVGSNNIVSIQSP